MPRTTYALMLCGLMLSGTGANAEAQARRSPAAFQPARRLFSGLFPADPRGRLRVVPPPPRPTIRERPANRSCEGCPSRPGSVHVLIDSPLVSDAWLARHDYQANGAGFGDNATVADFWYDAVHRRIMTRSAVLHEVDDPADVRLGRAPGIYPNGPDFAMTLGADTTVGQVGFETWTHNGYGAYFAAIQGTTRDAGTGYLDLTTVTGISGRTRSGTWFSGEELVRHVRLHPEGTLEVGFGTDPDRTPDPLLLVHGNAQVEGILRVNGPLQVDAAAEVGALVTGPGGNVPHACALREAATPDARVARVTCGQGQLAIGGGGTCGAGDLKGSRPMQVGAIPVAWEITCARKGTHTVYAICCDQ